MSTIVSDSGMARSWYGAAIGEFLTANVNEVLGQLSRHAGDGHFSDQCGAWLTQIELLQAQLTGLEGWIFFEFNIPRMGRRVDVILVLGSVIFALEFKVGETTYNRGSIEQVWDYALDLKNFCSVETILIPHRRWVRSVHGKQSGADSGSGNEAERQAHERIRLV